MSELKQPENNGQTFPVTAQVRLKHGILFELSKQFGSVRAFAEYLGLPYSHLNDIINFGHIPSRKTLSTKERWRKAEELLLALCGKGWDEIFPDELRSAEFADKPKRFEVTREVPIAALTGTDQALLMPPQEEEIVRSEMKAAVGRSLDSLPEREAYIVRSVYGFDGPEMSYAKIGAQLGITHERVRQILLKAIRALRHPTRFRQLKPFLDSGEYYPEPKAFKQETVSAPVLPDQGPPPSCNSEETKHAPLSAYLSVAVPLVIADIHGRGGPTDDDNALARDFAQTLAEKGDILLYGGKEGDAGELLSQLARALAVLAFQPGGVSVFGLHFEAIRNSR